MYEAYFGLRERPFSIAPDPHYLYMSERHQEAFAHLSYGIQQGGGFVKLTGEVGTGKTTLCRSLLSKLPKGVDVALILNPRVSERELLETVCDEFRVMYARNSTVKTLLDALNQHLLRSFSAGRTSVLIVDEAQLLEFEVLEMIRLLTNLETNKAKLLQIILIGQPELNHVLSRDELRQLEQRINARYHLGPLNKEQTGEYINYRLGVAGCQRALFSRQAINRVYRLSRGVPRVINVLCDHALLRTYATEKSLVNAGIVSTAAKEVLAVRKFADPEKVLAYSKAAAATILVGAIVWTTSTYLGNRPADPVQVAQTASAGNIGAGAVPAATTGLIASDESPALTDTIKTEPEAGVVASVTRADNVAPSAEELDTLLSNWSPQADDTDLSQFSGVGRVTVSALLAIHPDKFDRDSAYETLAGLWGVRLSLQSGQVEICDAVRAIELECLPGRGDWDSVQRFDRPGVLVLDVDRQQVRLVLQSLDNNIATVKVAGTSYELER